MKFTKLFALLLALTLVFTLAACGNGNNDDPSGSQQGTNAPLNREDDTSSTDNQGGENNPSNAGNIDIGSIMSGNGSTDIIYGQLDEASKQQIISETDSLSVAFMNATIEQIQDYAAKVKAAGFNLNEELTDENVMGMVIYSFAAENADGYTIEITSANGTSSLSISK